MNPLTTDTFFNGRVQVKQHRYGYRFSIDAVLLAWHTGPRPDDTIVDLGTGCGIIPIILAYRHPGIRVYGIEVQGDLADIARLNVQENNMNDRIFIRCMDMKRLSHDITSGPVDVVVCNPPFRKMLSGRINPDQERAVARHEIKTNLHDVIKTARSMLRTSGRFVIVYPAERIADILSQMRHFGIVPKWIRMIHSGKNTDEKLILIEVKKAARPALKIAPPLIIYRQNGAYTDEVEKMFNP